MTRGQICFLHEYCTNCPERKDCTIRPLFYSEEKYQAWKDQALFIFRASLHDLNVDDRLITAGADIGFDMMDKRKARELELYPTYSKE